MKHNISFMIELVKLRLSRLMTFRLGFFGPFFIDTSFFMVQLLSFQVIYRHVDTIQGWNYGEMMIFVGTFSMIDALNMILYFFGVLSIPEKIQSGELDLYITKPVNPLFRITFEKVNPGSIPLLGFSACILAYGVKAGGITLSFGKVTGYLVLVLVMTVLYYDMELLLKSFAFFLISVSNLMKLENTVIELCLKIPGTAFYGIYKLIFYVILPYGIMATVPTQFLTGTLSFTGILFSLGLTVLFTTLTLSFWKYGLKHYESASS